MLETKENHSKKQDGESDWDKAEGFDL
jgi:hypothetical protein